MSRSLNSLLAIFFLILLNQACRNSIKDQEQFPNFNLIYEGGGFNIHQKDQEFLLEVKQLYPESSRSEFYLLHPLNEKASIYQGITHQIAYPINRIAINATTHLGYLDALGMQEQIIGATSLSLYYSEEFRRRIAIGEVISIGKGSFSKEKLISLAPDVIFAYTMDQVSYADLENLRESGLKVVMVSEFLESDPIEKASWLHFFACFFGNNKLDHSMDLMTSIRAQYKTISEAVSKSDQLPKLMMGYPWKGSWYVSGGESYQAKFFEDAASDYLWSRFDQNGSVPLDIEVVLKEGMDADVWLNPGNKQSLQAIEEADQRFVNFKSFQNGEVYSNYKRSNELGANDCWERGVVRPDLILKDLAIILHPEIMGEQELYFYKKLDS